MIDDRVADDSFPRRGASERNLVRAVRYYQHIPKLHPRADIFLVRNGRHVRHSADHHHIQLRQYHS